MLDFARLFSSKVQEICSIALELSAAMGRKPGRKRGQNPPVREPSKRTRVGSRELNNLLTNPATAVQDQGFSVTTSTTLVTGTSTSASLTNTLSSAVTNPSSSAVNSTSGMLDSQTTGAVGSVGDDPPGFSQTGVQETLPGSNPSTNPLNYGTTSSAMASSQAASAVWVLALIRLDHLSQDLRGQRQG